MNDITISREDLKTIKLVSNKVLVKPVLKTSMYKLKNTNITLQIDTDYDPHVHAERVVEVVRVPKKLEFSSTFISKNVLPWETKMELQPGDKAWVRPLSVIGSEFTELIKITTREDKQVYFLLSYEDFFVAKRGEEVICLNGYVLIQPNKEDLQKKFKHIIVPAAYRGQGNTQSFKVCFSGSINTGYQDDTKEDFIDELKPGNNVVVWRKRRPYLMEDPLHACFNKKEGYFPIQRCDIVYILDESN